jgi:hypothetical protein
MSDEEYAPPSPVHLSQLDDEEREQMLEISVD